MAHVKRHPGYSQSRCNARCADSRSSVPPRPPLGDQPHTPPGGVSGSYHWRGGGGYWFPLRKICDTKHRVATMLAKTGTMLVIEIRVVGGKKYGSENSNCTRNSVVQNAKRRGAMTPTTQFFRRLYRRRGAVPEALVARLAPKLVVALALLPRRDGPVPPPPAPPLPLAGALALAVALEAALSWPHALPRALADARAPRRQRGGPRELMAAGTTGWGERMGGGATHTSICCGASG